MRRNVKAEIGKLLQTRKFDGATTEAIAEAAGVSPATALRALKQLEAEGFKAGGAVLVHGAVEAGRSRGCDNDRAPRCFHWFFT